MSTNAEMVSRGREAIQTVLQRSATDAEFRARLIAEPHKALAEYTGQELPESYDVRFIENSGDATFVLPDPVDPEAELSESELEAVAGGSTAMCVFTSIMGTMAVARGIKTLGDDDAWLS